MNYDILLGAAWALVVLALVFAISEDLADGFRSKERGTVQDAKK